MTSPSNRPPSRYTLPPPVLTSAAFDAIVTRTEGNLCHMETPSGFQLYLAVRRSGCRPPLPGQRVRVHSQDTVTWNTLQKRFETSESHCVYESTSTEDQSNASAAERAYARTLTAQRTGSSTNIQAFLDECVRSPFAPAGAFLIWAQTDHPGKTEEQVAEILVETADRFRGASGVESELCKLLATKGRPGLALRRLVEVLDLRLEALLGRPAPPNPAAQEALRSQDCGLVKDLVELALRCLIYSPNDPDVRDALVPPSTPDEPEIRNPMISLDAPEKPDPVGEMAPFARFLTHAAALDLLPPTANVSFVRSAATCREFYDCIAFWQRIQFRVEVSTAICDEQGATLVITPEQSWVQDFGRFFKTDRDRVLVRVWWKLPDIATLEGHREYFSQWRSKQSGSTMLFGIVVHPEVMLRDGFYRRKPGVEHVVLMPLDLALLQSDLAAGRRRLKELLMQGQLHIDLFGSHRLALGDTFFGRRDEFERFATIIDCGENVGLFGLRRMGKTSFLARLTTELPDDVIAIIDVELWAAPQMAHLWWLLAHGLREALKAKKSRLSVQPFWRLGNQIDFRGTGTPESNELDFRSDVENVLAGLNESSSGVRSRIIFVLDEIEWFLLADKKGFQPDVVNVLKWARAKCYQTQGQVLTVIAGANPYLNEARRIGGHDNPVFQFYREIYLPPFQPGECNDMVRTLGKRMAMTFTDDALDLIHRESGGHPLLTRQFCSFVTKENKYPDHVDARMIQNALDPFVRSAPIFEEIIGRLRDDYPAEAKLLEQIIQRHDLSCTEEELTGQDGDPGTRLRHLLDYTLIERVDGNLRVRSGMLRRWIARAIRGPS